MENQSQICNFVITNFFLICNTWKIRQFVIKNSFKYNDYIVKPCTLKTNFLLVVVHQHAEGQGTMIYMDQNVKKKPKNQHFFVSADLYRQLKRILEMKNTGME